MSPTNPPLRTSTLTKPTQNNWCGAVNRTPSYNPIQVLHTFWNHPECSPREGDRFPQGLASWGGIDGNGDSAGLLQAGTVCKVNFSPEGYRDAG